MKFIEDVNFKLFFVGRQIALSRKLSEMKN